MRSENSKKLIVALDLPTTEQAENLVEQLGNSVSFYKIGLALIPIGGFTLARELKKLGKKVFLDLKLFDIGHTISNTIRNLNYLDIDFLTVHGDPQVVSSAVKANENPNMQILAVTLLTSLNRKDLNDSLIKDGNLTDLVVERAKNAFLSGANGVIASPNEALRIRNLKQSEKKIIVTPGIRLAHDTKHDQKRISDPATAFKNGSDYIVVGRPILKSENPLEQIKHFQISACTPK
mgnify:FL=1|tara:strand:- start:212 stop:916 length:705 start_codon:yes stop_codon:yes gene_type:complete